MWRGYIIGSPGSGHSVRAGRIVGPAGVLWENSIFVARGGDKKGLNLYLRHNGIYTKRARWCRLASFPSFLRLPTDGGAVFRAWFFTLRRAFSQDCSAKNKLFCGFVWQVDFFGWVLFSFLFCLWRLRWCFCEGCSGREVICDEMMKNDVIYNVNWWKSLENVRNWWKSLKFRHCIWLVFMLIVFHRVGELQRCAIFMTVWIMEIDGNRWASMTVYENGWKLAESNCRESLEIDG